MTDAASDRFLVLSALGPDRPGLVAELSRYLTERGANIEESRMVTLGGEFGMLVLASGGPSVIERVRAEVGALEQKTGASVLLRDTVDPRSLADARPLPCTVLADALDHEGIVHTLAAALERLDVSIVSLETSSYPAPWTGADLFRFEATCSLPRALLVGDLRKALDEVARAQGIDVEVRSPSTR
jgi:glycine cleavage system transcriptional repressor